MSSRLAFIQMVREAERGDVGPLSVFADWLEERGEPLGEFIRLVLLWNDFRVKMDSERRNSFERDVLGAWTGLGEQDRSTWRQMFGGHGLLLDDAARQLSSRS